MVDRESTTDTQGDKSERERDIIEDRGAYWAQIGCLPILMRKKGENFNKKDGKRVQEVCLQIWKTLAADNRVSNLSPMSEETLQDRLACLFRNFPADVLGLEQNEVENKKDRARVKLRQPLVFELKLEARDENTREMWETFRYVDKINKCLVIWDCWIFMAFVEIAEGFPGSVGNAARDVLYEIFKDNEVVEPYILGPSPIHLDIMVEILYSSEMDRIKKGRPIWRAGD